MKNINPKYLKAFQLLQNLEPDRPRLLTPLPHVFTPFWNHAFAVMKNVLFLGEDKEDVLTAAILHDVLEDTEYTEETMTKEFGLKVTKLVKAVSKGKDYDSTMESDYYKGIYLHSNIDIRLGACYIKFADRIDNMYSVALICEKEYAKEYLNETKKYYSKIAKTINCENHLENLIKYSEKAIQEKN